jgi:hypothetical protein
MQSSPEFHYLNLRLALNVCLKNICDGEGSRNGSNGTTLYPPLFWLDNTFKGTQD